MAEKAKEVQVKKPNAIQRWWKETIGELRKVTWPTPREAWRLTVIVIIVMVSTAVVLGLLDFGLSKLVTALLA
ncbi:MAG TPA: preprotein translocase subunit SecE [Longilinea sp.]|nr:preprotein translocase subunit SecE [Longilinea sp.]